MRTTNTTPKWVIELVERVCADYKRRQPDLKWRNGATNNCSSGRWKHGYKYRKPGNSQYTHVQPQIVVTAGRREQDQKLVLLHELAHHLVGKTKKGRREHHSIRFWRTAFELYDKYGVDLEYAYSREKNYKVKASQAYKELLESKKAEANA